MERSSLAVVAALAICMVPLVLDFCYAGDAADVRGEWATQGHGAHVRIEMCATVEDVLCGIIMWLWEPTSADGRPVLDARNPDPKLRQRPLLGLPLLRDFRRTTDAEWSGGRIYNPENGRTYEASLRLRSPDLLEVRGCVLFLCDTQVWRRVESLCRSTRE